MTDSPLQTALYRDLNNDNKTGGHANDSKYQQITNHKG